MYEEGPRVASELEARVLWDGSHRMIVDNDLEDGHLSFSDDVPDVRLNARTIMFFHEDLDCPMRAEADHLKTTN